MQRVDGNNFEIEQSEIIAFCCVRNELLRLPYFLDYHRLLGIDRFIIIDNASDDGTKEFLLSQKDCNVFYTEESYASSRCGIDWLNALMSEYGAGHWIVTLDADEMLVYPGCENVDLHQLTKYLDSEGSDAIKTFLIDMYSDKPIKDTHYISGEPFLDHCGYFDSNSYIEFDKNDFPIRGGVRHRLFWDGFDRSNNSPYLINIPLIKWKKENKYEIGTHVISNLKISSLTGAKLHFKLFSDFYEYSKTESERSEHWDNASQYKTYWDVLKDNNDLCAIYDGSVKYENSQQIVQLGLMRQPKSFLKFIGRGNWLKSFLVGRLPDRKRAGH